MTHICKILTLLSALAIYALMPALVFGQSPPPLPSIYSGTVTVAGETAPDGIIIFAMLGDYISPSVTVANGRYVGLTVGPPNVSFAGQLVTFHIETVQADETAKFIAYSLPVRVDNFNLSFPNLPIPTPTVTPTPTQTPIVAAPASYSGIVFVSGASIPGNAQIVARIGSDYESHPVLVDSNTGEYGLFVDPLDINLIGRTVEFFINGVKARTTVIYESGVSNRNLDVIFTDFPTPIPTETPVVPTVTPIPIETPVTPTETPALTATPVPPTETLVPTATKTAVPPTQTSVTTATETPTTALVAPVPPTIKKPAPVVAATQTPTPEPPTATPAPVVPTPTESPEALVAETAASPTETRVIDDGERAGTCNSTHSDTSILGGAGNLLLLFAPLGAILALKKSRHKR